MREISQGKVIYSIGQKVDSFYLIRKGTVTVAYPGGRYLLQSGDVIGLCEMGSGISAMEYRAGTDLEVLVYSFGAAQMKRIFESSRDAVRYFSSSFFRQFNQIFTCYKTARDGSLNLYEYLETCYEDYLSLCGKYSVDAEKPAGFDELAKPFVREEVPVWLCGYYSTLEQMISVWDYNKTDYDFMYGFIVKSTSDIRSILALSQKFYRYQMDNCKYLMNKEGSDLVVFLFGLYEEMMYCEAGAEDVLHVRGRMDEMIQMLYRYGYDVRERKEKIVQGIRAIEEEIAAGGKRREETLAGAMKQEKTSMPEKTEAVLEREQPPIEKDRMPETEQALAVETLPEEEQPPMEETQAEEEQPFKEEEVQQPLEKAALEEQPQELPGELVNSLDQILEFSGCGEELADSFREHIKHYKKMPNKNGTEDDIRVLRQAITKEYNQIYSDAFFNSLDKELPVAVKMFFAFGYVDEELAGKKNVLYLYRMINHLPTNPEQGVYSVYEWLKEVYAERKEPSRNEFDTDYVGYLQEQKRMGEITAEEQKALLTDRKAKVRFELENMFPVVNKITFGRLTTFCPVYSEHNIMKPLETMQVTTEKIMEVLNEIRGKDYGAYYRETMYSNPEQGIPKETIHVEVLPDFILMPNAGIRGVMWQEIEGKRRTTPARMMVSIFQIEDLTSILIRLTGEFRWEMCKRVQGARWNDLSEKSLTSEYFDYIQFYRKNSELSPETKEKIKTDLGRTKNSFKEMFLRDYMLWVMFESNSSPRLNKVARSIFFTYCTFTEPVRQKLRANPLYQELADRCEIKMKQKRHKIENICQKLRSQGKDIPDEIQKEMDYMNM